MFSRRPNRVASPIRTSVLARWEPRQACAPVAKPTEPPDCEESPPPFKFVMRFVQTATTCWPGAFGFVTSAVGPNTTEEQGSQRPRTALFGITRSATSPWIFRCSWRLCCCSRLGGLPHRTSDYEQLNRGRQKSGKAALLDHIDVRAPLLPEYIEQQRTDSHGTRRGSRLHRVRGHLVRRGSSLFWRLTSPKVG